ncbi:MAG TPA: YdeI/OmpD-associated family protein [Thermoleophilaceae bacterium]|nr:YdeI/OmpD-associated family protein [Thermoleophilaceae bacterium]
MTAKRELAILAVDSRDAWDAWLAEQHETSSGVRLKLSKKGSAKPGVSYPDAVEVALAYGWIDGQASKFDDDFWLCRFTPRRPQSKWSKINRGRAEELIARGEMKPAGLRQVQQAKADGRWDRAYEAPSTATVPDDLCAALERNPRARESFETLDKTNRYAILYRIEDAKKPETRARRIEKYVAMLEAGEKVYP